MSGSDGEASTPTSSGMSQPEPPTPSATACDQTEFRRWQAQVASLMQAAEALANRSSSPNPTHIGQVPEVVDSTPFECMDTMVHHAPLEARLSSLEAQMAYIVTSIEDRLALSVAAGHPKLKRVSQAHVRHLSPVAEVDTYSGSVAATSQASTGLKSEASMAHLALLQATQTFSSHNGGQRL